MEWAIIARPVRGMGAIAALAFALRPARRIIVGLLVGLVILAAGPALAQRQTNPTPGIIIVDVQQAQRDSSAGKALMAQRDKYQQAFQADFNTVRQQLQAADQDLARQKATLAQEAYEQKAKALEQQVVAFQRRTQMAVRTLEKSTEAAASELMNNILTITGEIANELGASLVLPKQQVVLHEPRMDVTSQVIERLNRRMPNINFPEPVIEEPLLPPAAKSGKK